MTKEKRLAATKETKEQKDLLTEVWKDVSYQRKVIRKQLQNE